MKINVFVLLSLIYLNLYAQQISLEDVWLTYKFYPASLNDIRSLKNGETYTLLDKSEAIVEYNFKTGKEVRKIFSLSEIKNNLKPSKIEDYAFSDNEKSILIVTEKEKIYRHSSKSKCYSWNLDLKKLITVSENKVNEPTLSPDGKHVAYVFNNNLYYKNTETEQEIAITHDGEINKIINGIPDWVYEEEFSFSRAYEWSPDNKYIAYLRFDESKVKDFSMTIYKGLYPEEYRYKYPKAGEKNSNVYLNIYQLATNKTIFFIPLGNDTDFYIPRIYWTKLPNTLMAMKMNRLQNTMQLYLINAENGQSQVIYTEKSNTYIEVPEIFFAEDGKSYFITSDKCGYNHIYQYDYNGNLINQITKGNWEITKLNGYDNINNILYFTSTEVSPLERHIYSINLKTNEKTKLTNIEGYHVATFTSNYKYFIDEYSNTTTPTTYILKDNKGKQIRVLENNDNLKEKLSQVSLSKKEFFVLNTSEGVELNAWMIKPLNMQPTVVQARKKY